MNASHPTKQQVKLPEERGEYRPKLLFLAYYFPPLNSSGCIRTWNIAKYLARSGWDVTVVTPDPSLWRKVNDQNQVDADLLQEGIRRIPTGHRWRCLSPWDLKSLNGTLGRLVGGTCRRIARRLGIEMVIGWEREVESACASLSHNDVDVILASGPPFISFRLARSLSKRLERPYVLDYRDPWVTGAGSTRLRTRSIMNDERRILQESSAVTVISPSLLDSRIDLGSKKHVITNGFDPEEMRGVIPYNFGHFAIVYTGVFYPPSRVITPLMAALRRLKEHPFPEGSEFNNWKFHYFGPNVDHVLCEANSYGIADRVCIHGRVPRAEALAAVRGSSLTVVITSVLDGCNGQSSGTITGKLFEPLGMGVPILLVAHAGSDVEMIIRNHKSVGLVPARDIEGMTSFIKEVMAGKIPRDRVAETYAWPNVITSLQRILQRVMLAGH